MSKQPLANATVRPARLSSLLAASSSNSVSTTPMVMTSDESVTIVSYRVSYPGQQLVDADRRRPTFHDDDATGEIGEPGRLAKRGPGGNRQGKYGDDRVPCTGDIS